GSSAGTCPRPSAARYGRRHEPARGRRCAWCAGRRDPCDRWRSPSACQPPAWRRSRTLTAKARTARGPPPASQRAWAKRVVDDSALVIAFAALTGPLPKAGVVVVAALAAAVLLARDRRARALAMLGALVLAPLLLLTDIWNSPQLHIVHRHPLEAVVGAAVAIAALALAAAVIARRPWLVAPAAVCALPFRVPVSTGGTTGSGTTTANLLVPLYFVVAAGALAWIYAAVRGAHGSESEPAPPGRRPEDELITWVLRLLALYVVLYGIQAWYSARFEQALQNMVFFYVPFAVLLALLRHVRWD